MLRLLYTLLLLLATGISVQAQSLMRDWLVSMPDSVMPLLTKNNRLDFIDFYDAKMDAVVTNLLDGRASMDTLTADYALIRYTRSTDVALKLLPVNDSTEVLCMVTTVKVGVDDSRIAFFDAQWQPFEVAAYIAEPIIEDFRSNQQDVSDVREWSKLDIFFRTYALSAERAELECALTTTDYLSKEERAELAPYLRKEPLKYRWTNGKFVRDEQ